MGKTLYTSLLQEQVFCLPIRQEVINGSLVPPWRLPLFQEFLGLALSENTNLSIGELKQTLIDSSAKNEVLRDYAIGGRADAFDFLKTVLNLN